VFSYAGRRATDYWLLNTEHLSPYR
jgi:hypothetical protein